MIQFGTGGWRAVIGDGFTRDNIQRVATALGRRGSPRPSLPRA